MANYPAGKDTELVKAPMSTTDVDSAYAPNADAALKIPDAVRAYASITFNLQQQCVGQIRSMVQAAPLGCLHTDACCPTNTLATRVL